VIYGLIWKFAERIGIQGIQFIIQIILARLLFPKDYAVVALIVVFISIASIFVQSGFSSSLIQKKEVDDADCSSVFYLSLAVATVLYLVLFFIAPFIANFYNEPLLIIVLRTQAVILFPGAVSSIQNVVLSRRMEFKKSFYVSMGGVAATGIVGIAMAYLGFGVWALVCSQLANSLTSMVILWFTVAWRPKRLFSLKKVKGLYQFGWKLICSALLDTIYDNLRTLIIGKYFDKTSLGFYDRGRALPQMAVGAINGSISAVLFPALSACQDDLIQLKAVMRRSIVTSCFIMFPVMIGLAAVAEPMITILLTEKWLGAVPFMQLCCLSLAFYPLHTSNLQAINAVGRSDIFLKLEIIKKIMGLAIIVVTLPFGIYALVGGGIFASIIGTVINAFPNKKLINYSFQEQWRDILPSLGLSLIMGIVVYSVRFVGLPMWETLLLQVIIGISIYTGAAWIFKLESFTYLLILLKNLKNMK